MNEDDDLKRAFDAQRMIDQELAPSLSDLGLASATSLSSSPDTVITSAANGKSKLLRTTLVVLAIAVSILLVVFVSRVAPQATKPRADSTPPRNHSDLNRICDSVLVAIRESEPTAASPQAQKTSDDMDWPTGTDSLIPFDTLALYTRNSK